MTSYALILAALMVAGVAEPAAAEQQHAKPPAPKAAKAEAAEVEVTAPPAVEAAFKKAYPKATIRRVVKEAMDGKDVYEVESLDDGRARDLIYRPDGTLVQYEEEVAEGTLPPAVAAAIKTKYPKAKIALSEKLFKDGTMHYEIELEGANVEEVVVSPEGKLVSSK